MHKLFTPLVLALALLGHGNLFSQEQTPVSKYGFSARVLFIDFGTVNNRDSLNISNGIEVTLSRRFNDFINIAVPAKLGLANIENNQSKTTFFSMDIIGQLHFTRKDVRLRPYAFSGAGLAIEDRDGTSNVQIPIGLGLNIKVGANSYITMQGEYRESIEKHRDQVQFGIGWHFQLVPGQKPKELPKDTDGDGILDDADECPNDIGVAATAGCPDKDSDGVADKDDACPEVKGTVENKGCPDPATIDTDGDGIVDASDECPEAAGPLALNGCPDSDKDGVADKNDECPNLPGSVERKGCPSKDSDKDGLVDEKDDCPNIAGLITLKGCPDSDLDGIPDKDDDCPNEAGSAIAKGCPDADGDGVPDANDNCPNKAGPASNKGCPDIKKEDKETLEFAAKAVQFETGEATLKAESFTILNQIADLLNRYPDYKLEISGHTDDVGHKENNLALSEERAKSCYEYLLSKGVAPSKMSHKGYGELKPIASNKTKEGREKNRRVEFELLFK